jgi:hypothetical protein
VNGYRPPTEAIDAAVRAATLGAEPGQPLSISGIEVFEALTGARPLTRAHVAAMADHPYDDDSLCGLLFGGSAGRAWAITAAAGPNLKRLSSRLVMIDRRFRDRVDVILGQAMRTALRRADVKIKVRSRSRVVTAAALAPHHDEMLAKCYPPALLAALKTTTDELLHDSFVDAADQVRLQFVIRQKARKKLLREELGADYGMEWEQEEDRRGGALMLFVAAAMFAEASARISQPRDAPVFDGRGEIPVDPFVPSRITQDTVRVADGVKLGSDGMPEPPAARSTPAITPGEALPTPEPGTAATVDGATMLFDYTDELIFDVVEQAVPGVQVEYTWTVGEPERPFEPHQQLEGMTGTNDTFWIVFAKDPGEFPEGFGAWFPGDHAGCQCSIEAEYIEPG